VIRMIEIVQGLDPVLAELIVKQGPHGPKTYFLFKILDRDGRVIRKFAVPNRYTRDGASLVLRTIYRGESVLPAAFYGRLYTTPISDTSTLSGISASEVSGFGYAPVTWTRNTAEFGATSFSSTVNAVITNGSTKTFTPSGGDWTSVQSFIFATTADNTGVIFSYVNFTSINILNGQSFPVQPVGAERGVTF